ncbi:hypothetical protein AB7813_08125 [Tardiphaga sp. 20_F10_N6_6]|jgi:hypothetical protein|uniref:hypothetical protein n=1 Tax=Tardiphaga sp. 20_F10_N6_6 TaxID=3240788 RepID=UPI003F8C43A8
MPGILITEGATFALSGLSITINQETGEITMGEVKASLHYDVCPSWLAIAVDHLKAAKMARQELLEGRDSNDDEKRNRALEQEFATSMQVITSSAIAIDAFYAAIKNRLKSDAEPYDPTKRRSARHAQVSELIRQAFQLKPKTFDQVRNIVEQIFKFRDQAVHPTGDFSDPTEHPELKVGVERRLVVFGYENAFKIIQTTVVVLSELATNGDAKNTAIGDHMKYLKFKTDQIRAEPILELGPVKTKEPVQSPSSPT